MVFKSDKNKTEHHNRLNIRDRSYEPSNLFGDQNIPSTRNRTNAAADDDDDDLNARVPDDLPDLETAHVPHAERGARGLS